MCVREAFLGYVCSGGMSDGCVRSEMVRFSDPMATSAFLPRQSQSCLVPLQDCVASHQRQSRSSERVAARHLPGQDRDSKSYSGSVALWSSWHLTTSHARKSLCAHESCRNTCRVLRACSTMTRVVVRWSREDRSLRTPGHRASCWRLHLSAPTARSASNPWLDRRR